MTHTAKHTPGPWVVDTASISGDRIVKGASDQTIAQLHWHTASDANATLIAAAPAMYGDIASLAGVEGTVTIHKGIACLPDGTIINLLATKAQAEGKQL